jgi:hypothetical protein
MKFKKFIRAEEGEEKNSVVYYDEDENKLIRYWKRYPDEPDDKVSTRSWRNNNPGNLRIGPFARRNGAIGEAGLPLGSKPSDPKFAVFPDYETGRKAQAKRLKEGDLYIDLTLEDLPKRYVGVKLGNPDTKEAIDYRNAIRKFTKFDMKRTVRSLNDTEYEQLLDAMKRHEGWRDGREEPIFVKKILNVHVNSKRVISEFLVGDDQGKEWISKSSAISLAEAGRLHAIVVHAKTGTYLRPEYHRTPFKQLIVPSIIA